MNVPMPALRETGRNRPGTGLGNLQPVDPARPTAGKPVAMPDVAFDPVVPTVLHIITGLNIGGAETMLAKLVTHPDAGQQGRIRHEVVSLLPPGPVAPRIRDCGVTVHSLDMARGRPGPMALMRLAAVVRRVRPAILQGWMHHGNLAATVAGWMLPGRVPVVWNVRHSLADIAVEPAATRAILRLQARWSARPTAIIYNSRVAAGDHAAIGFCADRAIVIPNGFDCGRFAPDPTAGPRLRALFGINNRATVVAMVARNHPMKSAEMLANAVVAARRAGHDLHLLLVGNGMDRAETPLAPALARLPHDRLSLSGERGDVASWLAGIDILALPSSWGEAFPNILGEAMACGLACVTTDVGDSGWIIGTAGLVVPPRDVGAMARALCRLDRLGTDGRRVLGRAARARVAAEFSLDAIVRRYADFYGRTLAASDRAGVS